MKNKTNPDHKTGQRRNQVARQRVFIGWQGMDTGTAHQTRKIATQEAL
jgi:hypothetical protein